MLGRWWRRLQRRIDRQILWPALRRQADIAGARQAYQAHMAFDPAYSDLTLTERNRLVAELPPE